MTHEEFDRMQRLNMLKSLCFEDHALYNWTFDKDNGKNPVMKVAREYVDKWSEFLSKNVGLVLWGDVGTGKTFFAACIANALLEQGVPVLMTNFSKILNQMGGMYSDERYQYIASFSHYPLLIIDDLGIERNTEYALEQVYAVIDERYKAGLPVIITTNLTMEELRQPEDVAHARIYSRVLEMCTPVQITGEDRRQKIGSRKQSVVKEVLDL